MFNEYLTVSNQAYLRLQTIDKMKRSITAILRIFRVIFNVIYHNIKCTLRALYSLCFIFVEKIDDHLKSAKRDDLYFIQQSWKIIVNEATIYIYLPVFSFSI